MTPRAAGRLTRLGYEVFDYTLGKADLELATGLPTEGERPGPRCVLDATATRLAISTWAVCVVVDDKRVILGQLRLDDLPGHGSAGEATEPGPTTIRPSDGRVRNVDCVRGV